MLHWLIALPLIALLIERLIECLDALVTLNLFHWWRSAPPPPPRTFLQRPSRRSWRKGQPAPAPAHLDADGARVVHHIGGDQLEFPVNAYQEAVLYYEKEKALYRNQLKHYLSRHGHFLPRQADATGELWIQASGWHRQLEFWLARRERVPDVGKEAQFARLARDISVDTMINDRTRIHTLEKLTDYVFLRDRHTYAAFTFLKRQVYLILGIALGILVAELLGRQNLLPADPTWSPTSAVVSTYASPAAHALRIAIGALAGALSQPVHGVVNWAASLGRRQA
ncbi:MAG: hypothetical protein JXA09_03940 [Anaerolineae bacterium]|nr:hypothetical protein [Anaerolineae bacterium]